MSLGLVLSGGGARAAYQVGVLSAIAEICKEMKIAHPFAYYTGVSAGAINIAMLCAEESGDFIKAAAELKKLWSVVESTQVYKSDAWSLSSGGLQWLVGLSGGGASKASSYRALLDTSPLKKLIEDNCRFENIERNIRAQRLRAMAVSALDYQSTATVTFVQGAEDIPTWRRVRRQSEATQLTADHILASSAIPVLFPPVQIESRYFGDGCIRNHAPCAPAIYMGSDRLIAIGVRKKQEMVASDPKNEHQPPTVGRIANVLLNAVMMDGMEIDLERLERINENILQLSEHERKNLKLRPVNFLWIAPSKELSEIAANKVQNLPRMIRYLLKGLGSLKDASEIASFLLFDPAYCQELIELGYQDGMREKENIQRFIQAEN